jgi:hypothetical protein
VSPEQDQAWQRIRDAHDFGQFGGVLVFLSFIAAAVLTVALGYGDPRMFLLTVPAWLFTAYWGLRRNFLPCPACGGVFIGMRRGYHWGLPRRCDSCGWEAPRG